MEFLSMICIPINISLMLYTGDGQDRESSLNLYLTARAPTIWNLYTLVILGVVTEHVLLGLKWMIALAIPDLPSDVSTSEQKRGEVEKMVNGLILEKKARSGAVDYADILA
eukprot:CAMPEP_0176368124 /NCGR_PEP_ID=MMETSP0126-20121128/22375_1 /TAXON_ID=141414 ORGANISM="Strombidinopsis acuminatum, Strain SPMC142" /NCGR_SAMPLE_ID=MMETSP0126 /ASSEMBLY_ACC=CAM_ASM_000229 /LENGTH=110 /DNA_ID=CAMNT_0017726249 /DNA_START=559 /DNA_END=891 /DNA_ORIENTATION=+